MAKYMVTGSTGNFGGLALYYLSKKVAKSDIIGLARSEDKAKNLRDQGFDVRIGDYTNYESLVNAFRGVDRLLFVSSTTSGEISRQIQHENVVDAAKEAGVKFIGYTSLIKADTSQSPLATDHVFTENLIKESGLNYAILRNSWYLENEKNIIDAALNIGKFVYSAGEGKVAWALRREYAEAAANALSSDEDYDQIFELAGDSATYADLAAALANASDGKFEILSLEPADHKRFLINNDVPEGFADYLVELHQGMKNSMLDSDSNDLKELLGRDLIPLSDAVAEIL